jgi:hypothetical protein
MCLCCGSADDELVCATCSASLGDFVVTEIDRDALKRDLERIGIFEQAPALERAITCPICEHRWCEVRSADVSSFGTTFQCRCPGCLLEFRLTLCPPAQPDPPRAHAKTLEVEPTT